MTNEKPSIYYVLLSRKFWMSAIGLTLILVTAWSQDPFPTDAVVTSIMGVVAAFVAATAYEDGQRAKAEAMPMTKVEAPAAAFVTVTPTTSDTPVGRMGL